MRILVTGSNGLLGQKLTNLLQTIPDVDLIATGRSASAIPITRGKFTLLDVTDRSKVMEVVEAEKPDAVIHTAAMTMVDACHSSREECWAANVDAVKNIINACTVSGAHLVHVSTDFVFDGTHGPLDESAEPSPVNYYGESKLAAEKLVQASSIRWAIIRTVLVYGVTRDMSRSNIVLWVKQSLEQGREIKVVNDQYRTPTLAEDLAMGCYLAVAKKATGIYHISGAEMMTPYELALRTAAHFKLDQSLIKPVDSASLNQPAKRPAKTGFIISKAVNQLGFSPRSFEEGLCIVEEQIERFS